MNDDKTAAIAAIWEDAFRLMFEREPTDEERKAGLERLIWAALGAKKEAQPS